MRPCYCNDEGKTVNPPWAQINISYPGNTSQEREEHAISHLTRVVRAAEDLGLTVSWWFMRKGSWRIRYPAAHASRDRDPVHLLLTKDVTWTSDIYEPEVHAFGGPSAIDTAHTLFCQDTRYLITYLQQTPADRRERSLLLCTALMRAAGLDLNEQGDVWATVAQRRAGHPNQPPTPQPARWAAFTNCVHQLLLGTPRITDDWHTAFVNAGTNLTAIREQGQLTRGIRAVIAEHVIFHWNRVGLPGGSQAALAKAAAESVFGNT
ncbi:thiopeptide-type bacteriocin biosynthesis protein [Catellatospora citrea]|uniref:Thiopeptide-type bacteriocin biosynthesis domain-containing protein n=1 Tax=Catellatospora citrea TaxID=53366 RepID=A0A8J3KKN6_9ACTN|nr:thiopeptide-type bacteriocin biosynthesis protein [Catellatospora citrea]RKE10546.1 thiopeptide-type bacteriocin biosynthesis protein [Catellatospora citrea]GIF98790.1 hypothetical protein Cci01nite_38840 [Catellatospora citrea]